MTKVKFEGPEGLTYTQEYEDEKKAKEDIEAFQKLSPGAVAKIVNESTAKRYKKLKETDITCMSCGRGAWENSEGNTICSNCDKEENKCKCKPIKEGKYLVTFSEYLEFKYPKIFGDKTFNDFLYAKLPNKVFKSDGSYQNPRMNDYMDEYEQWLKTDEAVKVFKLLKSKNESTKQSPIFTLKECVAINGGKVILEKGETIAVLKESEDDWGENRKGTQQITLNPYDIVKDLEGYGPFDSEIKKGNKYMVSTAKADGSNQSFKFFPDSASAKSFTKKFLNESKLKESLDWDDIVDLARREKLNPKIIGFVNFIDKNKDKYKKDIKNFVDWWNEELDDADLDTIEKLIAKNPPEETGFEKLPAEDWKFYTKYA